MANTDDLNRDVQTTKEDATNTFGQLKDDAVRVAQSAADVGRAHVEQVKTKLNDGAAAVRTRLNDGTETVKTKLADGADAARDAAYRARDRGNDLLDQTKEKIEQNPLQAIAIAAGVGIVLGVLLRR